MLSRLIKSVEQVDISSIKRKLRPLGQLVTIFTLVYLSTIIPDVNFSKINIEIIDYIVLIVLFPSLYIILVFLMSYAWHCILYLYDHNSLRVNQVFVIYAKTSIYKYLPSNVFHFIGRQFYAEKLLKTQKDIAKSSLVENYCDSIFCLFGFCPLLLWCLLSREA